MNRGKGDLLLVWKLLLYDVSKSQLLIYALGIFLGLSIIGVGFQFYRNVKAAYKNANNIENSTRYIVLSKRIEGVGFKSQGSDITETLDMLRACSWVNKASMFKTADFNVAASVDFMGRGMSTALFLEAVPDEFLDIIPSDWNFNPAEENALIPLIVPKDYLALYNYGFAASRGLPKIGEDVMQSLPLNISFSGNGRQKWFRARIVGFTTRINSILVPEEVIVWGNEYFGSVENVPQTRIIAEINVDKGARELKDFIETNSLEIAGDESWISSANDIARIIVVVVLSIGAIISALSIALMIISITLLLHKTGPVISRLLAIGYIPSMISNTYTSLFTSVNAIVLLITIGVIELSQTGFNRLMLECGLSGAENTFDAIMLSVGIACAVTVLCGMIFKISVVRIK